MKQVRETKAGRSLSVYAVVKAGKLVATVQSHFGDTGKVTVNIWQNGEALQEGSASGYGYDKEVAALRGLTIDGHKLYDHAASDDELKLHLARLVLFQRRCLVDPPSALWAEERYFESVGAHLTNHTTISRSTGERLTRREGQWYHQTGEPCPAQDRVDAPTSVFYYPGLERLERLGYEVWRLL